MEYNLEKCSNGSSCLGLDLNIDSSTGTLPFEFPSVWADVRSYQSHLKEDNSQTSWINPGDHPENKKNNMTESIQMEETLRKTRKSFSLLPGEENLWFLVGDGLHEGIDRDFEKLVCEILDFNPFGQ
ncbi:hypothetical protein PNOK_0017100 [Pyrrhoderma noxium]|uniref:Uncharacterized protein n=1 Tax=Pyrrhoderma noxium TaxID=2282107 RepID=A0A286UU72_9AGAM|nr:hypothetical protein PNOK_0017100 [Pyrrhoderma noxium]